LIRFDIFQEFI